MVVTEPTPGRYVVRGTLEPQTLATLTAWCASHGVVPQDLAVGRRTLEQVFLELTGRGSAA
jgi:ABC-2 type transport system ATP-binding protein